MNIIKNYFKEYIPFAISEIHNALNYRISFIANTISGLIQVFVSYYIWKIIYLNSNYTIINGFSFSEITIYIFMSNITARMIKSKTDSMIGEEVINGDIAINLIRPINYHTRLLFQCLGTGIFEMLTLALPMWICLTVFRYITLNELPPNILTIILYIVSSFISFYILFLFNFCFGMLSFYVTYIWGLRICKESILGFLSGELIPLNFLPLYFQKILNFLPFGSINYTPVMIYLGKYTNYQLIRALSIQIIWVFILYFMCKILWKNAVKKLTILGG